MPFPVQFWSTSEWSYAAVLFSAARKSADTSRMRASRSCCWRNSSSSSPPKVCFSKLLMCSIMRHGVRRAVPRLYDPPSCTLSRRNHETCLPPESILSSKRFSNRVRAVEINKPRRNSATWTCFKRRSELAQPEVCQTKAGRISSFPIGPAYDSTWRAVAQWLRRTDSITE